MTKITKYSLLFLIFSLNSFASLSFAQVPIYKGQVFKGQEILPIPCCIPLHLRDGFYVGAGLGYDTYGVRQSLTAADDDGDNFTLNPNLVARGWVGEVYGGYGLYWDKLYLAGEILINSSSAGTSYGIGSGPAGYTTSVSIRESLGAALLPGLRLNRSTMFYVRLGYMRSYFKAQENGISPFGSVSESTAKWGNGLQYGVGIETAFMPNFQLRGEYTYTSYNSFSSELGTSFSPSNSQFMLSVNYHFCY